MDVRTLLGITLPVIQAPMAGVQESALALAVSNAGGLGSLPCAMLDMAGLARELAALRDGTTKPCNLNFFCHAPPQADAAREARWHAALAPYFSEFGIDPATIARGPGRAPFSAEAASLLEQFRPAVVSFHFGLPPDALLARAAAMWSAMNTAGRMEVHRDGERAAPLRLLDFPSEPVMCARISGWLEQMIELTGISKYVVAKGSCVAKGDKFCEWRFTW